MGQLNFSLLRFGLRFIDCFRGARDNAEGLLAVTTQRVDAFMNDAKWITPYGVPIEGELDALFKIEAIAE